MRERPGIPSRKHSSFSGAAYNSSNMFLPSCLVFVLRFPGAQRFRQIIPVLKQLRIEHLRDSTDVARAAAVEIQSGGGRVEIFRVGAVALTFEEFHCLERIEKICDAREDADEVSCRSPRL